MNRPSELPAPSQLAMTYVLVTPISSASRRFADTVLSVIKQTERPLRWMIIVDAVDDAELDWLRELVANESWIELVSEEDTKPGGPRLRALNAAQTLLADLDYTAMGYLEPNLTFDEEYFSFLLARLEEDETLGLVGSAHRHSMSGPYDYRFTSIEQVTGPVQLLRRQCFETIAPYLKEKADSIDRVIDLVARMKGWRTRTFCEKLCVRNREKQTNTLRQRFHDGMRDYSVGTSVLWAVFRSIYQMTRRPLVFGGLCLGFGFAWAFLRCVPRSVPADVAKFCRVEQRRRLRALFSRESLRTLISTNYFTIPLYLPRIILLCRDWPFYLFNYLLRRNVPAVYRLRDGGQLVDGNGALAGTMAVVYFRREYGSISGLNTIVDIGAHHGSFAVYAARSCPDARIYCFEPEHRNYQMLRQNIAVNGLEKRIETTSVAVAGTTEARDLAVGDSLLNSLHIVPDNARRQAVKCITIRDIIAHHDLDSVDLLKMNCEGAEYEIFESCADSEFEKIANIRLEYHNIDGSTRNGDYLAKLLEAHGYHIERFSRYRNRSGFIWASRRPCKRSAKIADTGIFRRLVTRAMIASAAELILMLT